MLQVEGAGIEEKEKECYDNVFSRMWLWTFRRDLLLKYHIYPEYGNSSTYLQDVSVTAHKTTIRYLGHRENFYK
jgi:hypothetical protein